MRHLQGGITNLSRLLTEDCAEQSLLGSQFGLTLRRNLTDQNISGTNLRTDADDSSVIQILQRIIADTRYIAGNLLGSELGITGFCLIFLNMDETSSCTSLSLSRTASS